MRALLSRIRPGLVYALFILLGSALQFDGYFLGSYGLQADFLLIFPLLTGMCYGSRDGLIIGLICGFARDYLAGRYFGLGMFITFLLGWASGYLPSVRGKLRFVFYALVVTVVTAVLRLVEAILAFGEQGYSSRLGFTWFLAQKGSTLPRQILINLVGTALLLVFHFIMPPYPRSDERSGEIMINFEAKEKNVNR